MIKKTKFRILTKFIASIAVGLILALFLLTQKDIRNIGLIKGLEDFLITQTIFLYLISAMLLLVPATGLYYSGKKSYLEMMSSDKDDVNDDVKRKAGYLDLSMTILGVYATVNFMQYGMLYNKTTENPTTILILFMLGILFTAILQVSTVKLVQKQDNRLKGDPTKTSFNKEFLDSMNEAEQLKVFKSGYRAFQTTKSITLMIVVFTIFMNILFEIRWIRSIHKLFIHVSTDSIIWLLRKKYCLSFCANTFFFSRSMADVLAANVIATTELFGQLEAHHNTA